MNANQIIERVSHLKSPSPTVIRLVTLLSQPEIDNEAIVYVVRQDGVLSAKLLALCNSATFGLPSVGSVNQAVLFLGFDEITRLVLSLGLRDNLAPEIPGYGMEPGALWSHSLLTAIATGYVCDAVSKFDDSTAMAYTAGLVHDIGKVVLNSSLEPKMIEDLRRLVETSNCSLLDAERQIIGAGHAEVGACLLQKWCLPDCLVEAVANHHAPEVCREIPLSAIIHVADTLVHMAGEAPGWGSFALTTKSDAVERMGLVGETVENLLLLTIDAREQVQRLTTTL